MIIEVDLMYYAIDYKRFNAHLICDLILHRLQWMQQHLGPDSLACINIRDFAETMRHYPNRVFKIVNFVSNLKPELRPFALLYEELGKYLTEVYKVLLIENEDEEEKEELGGNQLPQYKESVMCSLGLIQAELRRV